MFQQQVFLINILLMVLDAVCVICAGYAAHEVRSYQSYRLWSMDEYALALSILFVMFTNNIVMGNLRLYGDKRITSYGRLALAIFEAVCIDFPVLATVVFLLQDKDYSREFMLYFAGMTFILLFVSRAVANVYINNIARKAFNASRILVVGDSVRGKIVVDALEKQLSLGHQLAGHLDIGGSVDATSSRLEELPQILKDEEIDEVIFAVPRDMSFNLPAYIDICSKMGISVRILPDLWHPDKTWIRVEQCQGIPFITVHVNNFDATGLLYKRIIDMAGSIVGLIFLGIMYPLVALAIKLDSPGPVFFRQDRVGQNGRIFKAYKFRSMYVDAERRKAELMKANEMQGPMFKMKDDPRVTRVGRFLRRTSLDEFPQFINVFKGEMSLVGTRPPTPDEVRHYDLCEYKRISAKPGITGMWQVSGRNKITDFCEVVRLDCQYLEDWRLTNDIKILLKTCWVVLARKGAC